MEKINKDKKNVNQEDEYTCPNCNRPLISERSIGFGAEEKIKPCICTTSNQGNIGRIGWGN